MGLGETARSQVVPTGTQAARDACSGTGDGRLDRRRVGFRQGTVHACDPGTQKAEQGGLRVAGQRGLHRQTPHTHAFFPGGTDQACCWRQGCRGLGRGGLSLLKRPMGGWGAGCLQALYSCSCSPLPCRARMLGCLGEHPDSQSQLHTEFIVTRTGDRATPGLAVVPVMENSKHQCSPTGGIPNESEAYSGDCRGHFTTEVPQQREEN